MKAARKIIEVLLVCFLGCTVISAQANPSNGTSTGLPIADPSSVRGRGTAPYLITNNTGNVKVWPVSPRAKFHKTGHSTQGFVVQIALYATSTFQLSSAGQPLWEQLLFLLCEEGWSFLQ